MWHLLEPLHALLYYAPEAFDEADALGYDTTERWPSYFAWRAAPLGPVGPDRVADAFYSFSPAMIARYVPAAWDTAAPADVLAARVRAVDRTYRAVLGEELLASPELAEAAELARIAADAATA
ncbi:SCO6745 family protein, partial [Streptomyces venezuelae]|uniref:SCO6745 family protein n=1 Tax=Streptomyces venezuelae TaxID=54571 RepID=UPI003F82C21E